MQVFAHRGFSSIYPENTMTAFRKAYEAGADGLEFDARLTSDGHLVVMHDPRVDRTTNGSGIVRDMTLHEILYLDAGIKKGMVFENERVPLVENVLREFGGKMLLNIELCNYKEADEPTLADAVGELIEKFDLQQSVICSSFRFNNLMYMKANHPDVQCGLLAQAGLRGVFARNLLNHSVNVDALHPYYSDVNASMVRKEHLCGRKLRAWTVNEESEQIRLIHLGVDAIYADDPAAALMVCKSESLLVEPDED